MVLPAITLPGALDLLKLRLAGAMMALVTDADSTEVWVLRKLEVAVARLTKVPVVLAAIDTPTPKFRLEAGGRLKLPIGKLKDVGQTAAPDAVQLIAPIDAAGEAILSASLSVTLVAVIPGLLLVTSTV